MDSPHIVHPSLYRTVLMAGVPPRYLIFEVSLSFALVFILGLHLATLLVTLVWTTVVHSLLAWACGLDPEVPQLYVRSLRGGDFYHPMPGLRTRPSAFEPALPYGS